ncbi:hypothetical protein B0G80_2384 [Paraburkholderia sp. BL6669N2]|nr:hypothetical protein B0G80_2384 [Paraburkholderia sp. BL6669N2]
MKLNTLVITVASVSACVGASSVLAETPAALSDNDTATTFGSGTLTH